MEAKRGIFEKLFWTWTPKTEREAGDSVVRNLLLHWFPAKVTNASLSFGYSFWLGTISAVLFALLALTGMILMFLYVPSVERAYQSIKDIEFAVAFGWYLRGVHRISAHLMVAVVFLHMVRVFLTGAYRNGVAVQQNRPLNWIIGVALLLCTLLLSFTGYLLPWDQLAYWAIMVGTNIASAAPVVGERDPVCAARRKHDRPEHADPFLRIALLLSSRGGAVPVRVAHVAHPEGSRPGVDRLARTQKRIAAIVPTKTYSLLGVAKGRTVHVEASLVDEESETVPSSPNLTQRLLVVTLVTVVAVSLLAIALPTPLEEAANPKVTPNPAKAPWYFLWLQELVTDTTIHLGGFTVNGAFVGGILIPGLIVAGLIVWPFLDRSPVSAAGVWFAAARRRQNTIFLLLVLAVLVLTIIGTFLRGPFWHFYWPWDAWPEAPKHF